jgi:hypothetical protein
MPQLTPQLGTLKNSPAWLKVRLTMSRFDVNIEQLEFSHVFDEDINY